ncbi:PaaR repeat-containing protein (plasmid) [Tistrella mobilis]|uniref:PAAR domain-containing protein n=1 Tax=Tistrella mobilis TaxID=171437 RepID=UPI003558E38B
MPPVTLKGDACTGHGCWPGRPSIEGEARLTVGGRPVVLVGHAFAAHTCPAIPETHGGVLAAGAPRLTVGGRAIGRIDDPVSCGSRVAQGDARIVIGD